MDNKFSFTEDGAGIKHGFSWIPDFFMQYFLKRYAVGGGGYSDT